ncbi:Crp/Fnr family transcriptional regulator [Ginsengibacter hankyongi]|uniref:Crp/Fnr family transcriptional regulator n=2 Tax=Ginsengibacter hankyongi TaxID=2607284 RepID=A0A5J5ID13_9BACT|nr:Crp/Fnr family transcriptional regulator [Ginsengibacter hankyongi]
MNMQKLIEFIKANTPNIMVSQKALEKIVDHFEERILGKNDYLLKAGRNSSYFYLADGFMRAFTYDFHGNEVTTYFYPKDRVVFEIASLILDIPSTEYIEAITECKGYLASCESINKLFHAMPEFREFSRMMMVREFVAYKERTLSMINKSAEERYRELLRNNMEVLQHAQMKHIASYLGITDTSLSRIRRNFLKKAC